MPPSPAPPYAPPDLLAELAILGIRFDAHEGTPFYGNFVSIYAPESMAVLGVQVSVTTYRYGDQRYYYPREGEAIIAEMYLSRVGEQPPRWVLRWTRDKRRLKYGAENALRSLLERLRRGGEEGGDSS